MNAHSIKIGDRITFNRPVDSFYGQASGIVTKVKNSGEWFDVQADKGRERFARDWKVIDCAMGCKVADIVNA